MSLPQEKMSTINLYRYAQPIYTSSLYKFFRRTMEGGSLELIEDMEDLIIVTEKWLISANINDAYLTECFLTLYFHCNRIYLKVFLIAKFLLLAPNKLLLLFSKSLLGLRTNYGDALTTFLEISGETKNTNYVDTSLKIRFFTGYTLFSVSICTIRVYFSNMYNMLKMYAQILLRFIWSSISKIKILRIFLSVGHPRDPKEERAIWVTI